MATINDLENSIDELTTKLNSLTDTLGGHANAISREQQAMEAAREQWAKTGKTIASTADALAKSAKSATSQEGAIRSSIIAAEGVGKSLSSALGHVPKIGKALEVAGEGLTDLAVTMVEHSLKMAAVFGKLSNTGVVESFSQISDVVATTGLNLDQLAGVFEKNSEALAIFGKTANDGTNKLSKILEANKSVAVEYQKLGMSFGEFSEVTSNYVSMQVRSNHARKMSESELIAGSREYADRLIVLSRLTGKSTESLQKQQNEMLSYTRYQAALVTMSGPAAKQFEDLVPILGDSKNAFMDIIASGGLTTSASAELAQTFQLGGLDIVQMIKQMKSGQLSTSEAYTKMTNAAEKAKQALAGQGEGSLASVVGPDSPLTRNFGLIYTLSLNAGKSFGELTKEIKTNIDTQKKADDPMAEFLTEAQSLSSNMTLMLQAPKILLKAAKGSAYALDGLAAHVNRLTGRLPELPEHVNEVIQTENAAMTSAAATSPAQLSNRVSSAMEIERLSAEEMARRKKAKKEVQSNVSSITGYQAMLNQALDYVGKFESGGNYDIMWSQKVPQQQLTDKTVAEVLQMQKEYEASGKKSSAAGKYQAMPATIMGLIKNGIIKPTDKFDKTTQDKIGEALLLEKGFKKFLSGDMPVNQFADNITKVWAALPTQSGKTAYDNGLNAAGTDRASFISQLSQIASGATLAPSTLPSTPPSLTTTTVTTAAVPSKASTEPVGTGNSLLSEISNKLGQMLGILEASAKTQREISKGIQYN